MQNTDVQNVEATAEIELFPPDPPLQLESSNPFYRGPGYNSTPGNMRILLRRCWATTEDRAGINLEGENELEEVPKSEAGGEVEEEDKSEGVLQENKEPSDAHELGISSEEDCPVAFEKLPSDDETIVGELKAQPATEDDKYDYVPSSDGSDSTPTDDDISCTESGHSKGEEEQSSSEPASPASSSHDQKGRDTEWSDSQ